MSKFEDDLARLIKSSADGKLQFDVMDRMWQLGLRGKEWDTAVADCLLGKQLVKLRKKKRG